MNLVFILTLQDCADGVFDALKEDLDHPGAPGPDRLLRYVCYGRLWADPSQGPVDHLSFVRDDDLEPWLSNGRAFGLHHGRDGKRDTFPDHGIHLLCKLSLFHWHPLTRDDPAFLFTLGLDLEPGHDSGHRAGGGHLCSDGKAEADSHRVREADARKSPRNLQARRG